MFSILAGLLSFSIGFIAFRNWIQYRRLSPKSIQKTLSKASQMIALEEWEKADLLLKELYQQEMGGKQTLLFYCQVLRGTHQLNAALECARKGESQYSDELLFRLEAAKILLEQGENSAALQAFEGCFSILRSESDLLDFATALFQTGEVDRCFEILSPLLGQSQNEKCFALAGDCLFHREHFPEAIELYRRAIALSVNHQQILTQLGHALRCVGDYKEAETLFRKILAKDSGDVSAILGLGISLMQRGLYQKALLIYQSGKAWELKDPRILKQAGICALKTHKFEFAQTYFIEVLEQQGATPTILSFLGYTLECQKKWKEAEEVYFYLLQQFPQYPNGYRSLAWLYGVGLSNSISPEDGIWHAYRGLELLPDPTSWEILSACEARAGNFTKAHQIQEHLFAYDTDKSTRQRRQHAMRSLRKQLPLEETHVSKVLVA